MDQGLIDLYHRHVAAAFDRQLRLGALLEQEAGGAAWQYTISKAKLTFGTNVEFTALDLGSHADPDNSWLWTWCNPNLNLTADNWELAHSVQKLGHNTGIAIFTADRQVSCEQWLGDDVSPVAAHAFAVILAGELGFDAYYTIPFTHGRSATLIRDKRLQAQVPDPAARIVSTFSQAISAFPILDHRAAFIAYAEWYGLTVRQEPIVRVLSGRKELMIAEFDARNRLTKLNATISPSK
jgi:hypothetical protein